MDVKRPSGIPTQSVGMRKNHCFRFSSDGSQNLAQGGNNYASTLVSTLCVGTYTDALRPS